MAEDYTVNQGDCISSIAFEHGFFWRTLWDHDANASLKGKRKSPNVLLPGDVVHIPDLRVKQESGGTEQRHRFRLKGVPAKLRLRLLDGKGGVRSNLDFILKVEGATIQGTTDGDGRVDQSIPPNARTATLSFKANGKEEKYVLNLGHTDPVSEGCGVQQRLKNLGYGCGPEDSLDSDKVRAAVKEFQSDQGLPVTGATDDATLRKLKEAHGS